MADYVETAIRSVLSQGVSDLEYIVLDGGSADGTVDILRKYDGRLRWHSRPDHGAAAALREGFAMAGGDVLGWLNADDVLEPGALRAALEALRLHPDAAAVYGDSQWIDSEGHLLGNYPTADFSETLLAQSCIISQPACFFRASAYRAAGGIDGELFSAFDYELWIRMARVGPFVHIPQRWASSRMHATNKTLGSRGRAFSEGMSVLERHFGYVPFSWIYSQRIWERDGRDQFFQPMRPSLAAWMESLPRGLRRNSRHQWRYIKDWAGAVNLRARLRRFSPQSPSR